MAQVLLSNLLNASGTAVSSLRITQLPYTGGYGSHSHSNALDVASGGTAYSFYAPVDMYYKGKVFDNAGGTLMFQSTTKHSLADGTEDYFCISFSHMNTSNPTWNTVTSKAIDYVFTKGTKIYEEGTNYTESRHCHIRVGKGTFVVGSGSGNEVNRGLYLIGSFGNAGTQYDLNTSNGPMLISDAFFSDNMSFVYEYPSAPYLVYPKHRLPWKTTTGSYNSGGGSGIGSVTMYPKSGSLFYIRKAPKDTGYILTRCRDEFNEWATIRSFLPKKCSDGFQWALVKFGATYGYAQVDLYNWNRLSSSGTTAIKLHAVDASYTLRPMTSATTVNLTGSGSVVSPYNDKDIIKFLPVQTNGYQYAQTGPADSGTSFGRASQLDQKNAYIIDGYLHVDNVSK